MKNLNNQTPDDSGSAHETTPQAIKPLRPLTRKEKAFTVELIKNPKQSATQAALKTYDTTSINTAAQIASENLKKPQVQLELEKYSSKAEEVILEVMDYSRTLGKQGNTAGASYANVALTGAKDILDRVHGRATTRVEATSTTVNLSLSLTDILPQEK